MPVGQAEEILALSIVFLVHVVGGLLLVWGVLGDEGRGSWRRRWGGGGTDDDGPPREPEPAPPGERSSLPLPDADWSRVRLREDGRVAGGYERPARRPEHPPQHAPTPSRRGRG